jgi:phospholipid/cholesterol/gamma-HCH transport system substrate-binding protein
VITKRIIANVIFFLAGSVVLIFLLVVLLFQVEPKYAVFGTFEQSGGVFTGQEVTYRGVTVGRVGRMQVDPDGVRIEMVISRDYDRISRDARARIMFKSAVGEQFIDLLPDSAEPPFLGDGDEIPLSRTSIPVQQEELLRLLAQVLDGVPPESIRNLVNTLGTGLGGRGDELSLAFRSLDPISATLAARVEELNRLNVSGDRLGTAFDRTQDEFVAGVRSLADVAETLGSSSGSLERLIAAGATDGKVLADLVAARKQEIESIIADLARNTSVTFDNFESLKRVVDLLDAFLGTFIEGWDPALRRFRFGQVNGIFTNPPCDYGTPHRAPDERGDAPYHPILGFPSPEECDAAGGNPQPASVRKAATPPEQPPGDSWMRVLTDTLPE